MSQDDLTGRVEALREATAMCEHLIVFADACRDTGKDRLSELLRDQIDVMVERINREYRYVQGMAEQIKRQERADFIRRGGYRSGRVW